MMSSKLRRDGERGEAGAGVARLIVFGGEHGSFVYRQLL
jgi:hypothetical protein